jgi:hypothetical protein
MAIELTTSSAIPDAISQMERHIIGTRVYSDGERLVATAKRIPIRALPPEITDLVAATDWIAEHQLPPFRERLASISCNNNIVALNVSHLIADGTTLSNFLNNFGQSLGGDHKLLLENYSLFADEIAKLGDVRDDPADHLLFHISPPAARFKHKTIRNIKFEVPLQSLASYGRAAQRLRSNTEHIWASFLLAGRVVNGAFDRTGISTCINMRQFLKSASGAIGNSVGNVFASAGAVDPRERLSDVTARMRSDFHSKVARGEALHNFKTNTLPAAIKIPPSTLQCESSSVNRIICRPPIKDIRFSLSEQKVFL